MGQRPEDVEEEPLHQSSSGEMRVPRVGSRSVHLGTGTMHDIFQIDGTHPSHQLMRVCDKGVCEMGGGNKESRGGGRMWDRRREEERTKREKEGLGVGGVVG